MREDTTIIHACMTPDSNAGSVTFPIYQTSTFVQESPGKHKGYVYARVANPTRNLLEKSLAMLENASHAYAFASGMAAIDTLLKLLAPGEEVVCTQDLYGGAYRLFEEMYRPLGIKFHYLPLHEGVDIESCFSTNTRMVWIETPTNPLLRVIDIQKISEIAKTYGALTVVDNTFASPYLQKPLDLGADVVMHSVSKYLSGHSDLIMGALATRDEALATRIGLIQYTAGAIASPMDSFLTLRGIKTLHVRMQRHVDNARKVAQHLGNHAAIDKLYWPGDPAHPQHEVAKRQMRDFGAMISFVLKKNKVKTAHAVLRHLRVFTLAESLGGVESLANHPATMTHASIPEDLRKKNQIEDGLVRLSVGIENPEDLCEDLDKALASI